MSEAISIGNETIKFEPIDHNEFEFDAGDLMGHMEIKQENEENYDVTSDLLESGANTPKPNDTFHGILLTTIKKEEPLFDGKVLTPRDGVGVGEIALISLQHEFVSKCSSYRAKQFERSCQSHI